MIGVFFRCMSVMLGRMQRMSMRHLGVVRGLFVVAGLGVLGRLAMVLGRMLMMLGGFLVMIVDFVTVHCRLPGQRLRCKTEASPGSVKQLRHGIVGG